ncbi:eggshell protein-like [Littorina saxatilis]|uniref:Uncharacterized protein n=1 Tax=Littorina saxatilis TaxID=31220 RepID=A0AAN9AS90_9CAEN
MTSLFLVMTCSLMTSVLSQVIPGVLPQVVCQKFKDYCNGNGGFPQCCPGLACVNERCTGQFTGSQVGGIGGFNNGGFSGVNTGGFGGSDSSVICTRQGDTCGRRGPCCPGTVCVQNNFNGGFNNGFNNGFNGGFNNGFNGGNSGGLCTSIGNLPGFGVAGGVGTGFGTGPFLDQPSADNSDTVADGTATG